MNNLEKALLIKELSELTNRLSRRNMSLYEVAKSKNRLCEIYKLCDDPVFKDQILAFKSITQPEIAAYEFSKTTPYAYSFRGYFICDEDLETALYQQPEMGWALLHDPKKGWQIWLIPAPQRTALLSEWSHLTETITWLEEQQSLYACLIEDQELLARAVLLQPEPEPVIMQPKTLVEAAEQYDPNSDYESYTIVLEHWEHVELTLVKHPQAKFKKIYQIELLQNDHPLIDYVTFIGCYKKRQFDLSKAIYVSEQLNAEGIFEDYLVILGASDQQHALELLSIYQETTGQSSNCLKSLSWSILIQHLNSIHKLFDCLQKAETFHQAEYPIEFIPRELFHARKLLKFQESAAGLDTPILLLKERHKIRVIHGENRLDIHPNERAYPFLLLHRQDGLSWQTIQSKIDQLPQPIDVMQFYQSLTEQKIN